VVVENVHLPLSPLDFFDYVEAAVEDELVEVADLVVEARLAVAAGFGGAELVLEEGVVLRPDDDEVVRHGRGVFSSGSGERRGKF
jgi:hypothetical protein